MENLENIKTHDIDFAESTDGRTTSNKGAISVLLFPSNRDDIPSLPALLPIQATTKAIPKNSLLNFQ